MRKQENQPLHITFHNPNTPEAMADYLIKIIATDLVLKVVNSDIESSKRAV